jgi:hypothetical protein
MDTVTTSAVHQPPTRMDMVSALFLSPSALSLFTSGQMIVDGMIVGQWL